MADFAVATPRVLWRRACGYDGLDTEGPSLSVAGKSAPLQEHGTRLAADCLDMSAIHTYVRELLDRGET